mgnify:CR=1 FL=1
MSQEQRPTITASAVIALLDDGKDREQIREHFGLNKTDLKKLFSNPALKGKKTRKAPAFVFEDDTKIPSAAATEEVSNDAVATTTEDSQVDSSDVDDVSETASNWAN